MTPKFNHGIIQTDHFSYLCSASDFTGAVRRTDFAPPHTGHNVTVAYRRHAGPDIARNDVLTAAVDPRTWDRCAYMQLTSNNHCNTDPYYHRY